MNKLEIIIESNQQVEDKKRNIVDTIVDMLKSDEDIASISLREIEDSWAKLEADTNTQVDSEYHQALRNFKKQKERVDTHLEGKQLKEDLLEEMNALKENVDFKNLTRILYEIKDEFDDAPYAGKKVDGDLNRKFSELFTELMDAKDAHFGNMEANRENAKVVKEALIVRAKEAANSTKWKETSKEMRELMEEWKAAGNAGREHNDALWESFNEVRQDFFARQDEFFKNQESKHIESKEVKEGLIKEALAICNDEDIKATSEKMKELMAKWKAVGTSGRQYDDSLWNEFQAARKVFFDRQSEYYEAKKGKFVDNLYDGIKRRNKQLADLEKIVKDLEERVSEVKNLEPVMGNHEDRWEITNERNQEMKKYNELINEYNQKIVKLQDELKEMDEKYKNLTE